MRTWPDSASSVTRKPCPCYLVSIPYIRVNGTLKGTLYQMWEPIACELRRVFIIQRQSTVDGLLPEGGELRVNLTLS